MGYGNPALLNSLQNATDGVVTMASGAISMINPVAADTGKVLRATGAGTFAFGFRAGCVHDVTGVHTANVTLTNFTMAATDNTFVAGDRVLLTGQTSKAENGIYTVGADGSGSGGAGTAALTRPDDFFTGAVLPAGASVEVNKGTLFAQTHWKITTAGAITVGTTAHDWYPRSVTYQVALSSGVTAAVTTIPILSASKTMWAFARVTASSPNNTVMYNATSVTPGVAGTASFIPMAQVAAGTVNAADGSTMNITVINF